MRYDTIIDYLCSTAGPSFFGAGSTDKRVDKFVEAGIAESLRRYIVDTALDEGNDFFRIINEKSICIYNGKFFEMMNDVKFEGIIRNVMRKCEVGIVYLLGSVKAISAYLIDSMLSEDSKRFRPNRRYVCFENCVLDLKDMMVYEHSSKYCTDLIMNFDYDCDARSGLWDNFIATTVPDNGMRKAYQQFCGAFLLNRHEYKFEYMCFLIGEGQNGKSIAATAIVNIFKNENEQGQPVTKCVTTYTPEQLFKSQQMDYHMADVQGKVMNYCDDVSDKDFSGGDFKAFVSGGEFRGRSPYGRESVDVTDIPLLLCCANKIPPTTDDSDGYFRRFLIINCPNKVSEKDKDTQLSLKLKDNKVRSAIFNWMIDGYQQLIANNCKIDMSESVKALKDEMKSDSNSARRWIREFGYVSPSAEGATYPYWKPLKEWMQIYAQYCKDYSDGFPKTSKSVCKIFDELGFERERRSDGIWYGLSTKELKTESAPVFIDDEEDDSDLPLV